jgi:AraC-like DNA-binding protein
LTIQTPSKLYIDIGKVLFVGPVESVATHRCVVPMFAVGLDREFEVCVSSNSVGNDSPEYRMSAKFQWAKAGLARSVHGFSGVMGVMLIDPGLPCFAEVKEAPMLIAMETLRQGFDVAAWRALSAEIGLPYPTKTLPTKVHQAAMIILENSAENLSAEEIARRVGLSVSRLEHLFTKTMGTPLRSFRQWQRFRAAAQALADGCNFTSAAHAAGFYDSAHFNHAFKLSFGLSPSEIFRPNLQISVVPSILDSTIYGIGGRATTKVWVDKPTLEPTRK